MKDTFIYIHAYFFLYFFRYTHIHTHTVVHTSTFYTFFRVFKSILQQLLSNWILLPFEARFTSVSLVPLSRPKAELHRPIPPHIWGKIEREREREQKRELHRGRGAKKIPIICSNISCVHIVTINLKCAGQDRSFEPTSSTACQLKWKCLSFRCNKSGFLGGSEGWEAARQGSNHLKHSWAAPALILLWVFLLHFHVDFYHIWTLTQFVWLPNSGSTVEISAPCPMSHAPPSLVDWLAACRLSASRIALALCVWHSGTNVMRINRSAY